MERGFYMHDDQMRCPECGTVIKKASKKCTVCGYNIRSYINKEKSLKINTTESEVLDYTNLSIDKKLELLLMKIDNIEDKIDNIEDRINNFEIELSSINSTVRDIDFTVGLIR